MDIDTIEVTRFAQNCSILSCPTSHKAAIIDPGGDLADILYYLELIEAEAEVILITHGHMDHAGGAAELAAQTGARIEGPHIGDERLLACLAEQGARYGLKTRNVVPDRWLEHGDQVRFGDAVIEVLHCPGHTRGHVAYFSAERRQAFVGDILFRHTIGAWEHADGDLPQLIDSIRLKLFPLGDDVVFVPGHGRKSTFGHEREANPFVGDVAHAGWLARRAAGGPGFGKKVDPKRPTDII